MARQNRLGRPLRLTAGVPKKPPGNGNPDCADDTAPSAPLHSDVGSGPKQTRMIGRIRIATRRDGTYEPDPQGEYAVIAPVYDRECELADLVAWFPGCPGTWWLRHGAEPLLGARALAVSAYFGDKIELYARPEAWFLGGGRGACVLRWDIGLDEFFAGIPSVLCDGTELERRLQSTLRQWEPEISVIRQEVGDAV